MQQPLLLPFSTAANKDKTETFRPALRLPCRFEIAALAVESTPTPPSFDHALELRETLEGDTDAQLHTVLVQRRYNLITEKGGIHPHFDMGVRQDDPQSLHAGQNKGARPMRVMHRCPAGAGNRAHDRSEPPCRTTGNSSAPLSFSC